MDLLLVDIGFVVADDGLGAGEPYTLGFDFFPGGGNIDFVKDNNIDLLKMKGVELSFQLICS